MKLKQEAIQDEFDFLIRDPDTPAQLRRVADPRGCPGHRAPPQAPQRTGGIGLVTKFLRIVPCNLATANAFVRRLHRHSRRTVGHKFSIAVSDGECIRGVAIVGRPVSRFLDDGFALEINRVCTDGTANACSILYGAARRTAKAMGYRRIFTYTLPEEGGASLRAAGFLLDKESAGGSSDMWHSRPGRTAQPVGDDMIGGKWRWTA